jgi:Ribonuclease G/E
MLDRRPERLLIDRRDHVYPQLGVRYRARVLKIERGAGLALLDLGANVTAALRLKADRPAPVQGQGLEVEIAIEPQGDKAAVARMIGVVDGAPGRLNDPPTVRERLLAFAPEATVTEGAQAREAADRAEDEALAIEHPLPGGGSIALETTRALTAVDVDLGSGAGRDPKRAARDANLSAICETARLMRLKALGGVVVIDLVGRGHDGPALTRHVQTAFGPDQPGVVIGPITKFGTLELALPRRLRPVRDVLCDATGRLSAESLALRLTRAIEREGRADPGGRVVARCAPEIEAAVGAYMDRLKGALGARIDVIADSALARETFQVSVT